MLQVYELAHELGELDITKVLDLPLPIYRGWVVWFDKRKKDNERRKQNG